ncbi:Afadin [Caenorhabditis elegans]|nr:Afadin [Caenorhabditis elegans]CDO41088.1 Afadin [Caenorhabditis elegans]|eukprot:NP_001293331.1 AFaDin (actin filament binding protein) homolog [Caenorhabditis elegans]
MSDLREIDGRPIPPTECPLFEMTARSGNGENGFDSFLAIKRKPHDYQVPSTSVVAPSSVTLPMSPLTSLPPQIHNLPVLIVMNNDGHLSTHRITLHEGVTEVGSDSQMSNFSQHNIYLDGPDIRGRHAAIAFMEGVVTLTPSTRDAYLEVNGHQLMQTEILRDGDHIRIGADHSFKFSTSSSQANQINSTNISNSNQRHFQQQTFYPEMADSRASTARCAPSDYCSLPQQNDYYPPSMSGSSVSSSRQEDLMMHSNNNILPPYSTKSAQEPLQLPLSIQIGDYNVWDFLAEVMSNRAATSSEMSTFRLSPAYSLYLALRSFHTHNKPYSVQFFSRIESNFKQIAQECSSKDDLIFWLANASEFNHLVERDTELKASRYGKISVEIERIFRRLVAVLQSVIRPAARALLDIHLNDHDATGDVIHLLDTTMRQARICGLNAALTIQLCGHLLHMVNAFVFNSLVSVNLPAAQLNTRLGKCLQYRIESIHRFCERMGVEMAAECHLDRSRQAANLLATQKNDVAALGSTCYKLNSLQVVHILSGFEPDDGEIPCDDDVVDRICRLAEKQADKLTLEDGQRVTLEESDELNLPFLIPQDGYFVEQFRTVPDGLWQYLQQLQHRRLCHTVSLTPAPPAAMTHSMHAMHIGASDAHYHQHQHQQQQNPIVRSVSQTTLTSIPTTQFGDSFGSAVSDTISKVTLRKNGGGIGLSIVAAQGVGDRQMGIYVKKVVEGTPAAHDGRLETGDQLLSVNGHSLIGISQEDAARLMTQSGNEVHFDVRKRAAHRNGLSNWLGSQTPTTSNFIAPSPSTVPPPSYSHVGRTPSYDGQPPPSYNHRNGGASGAGGSSGRNSAFVAPLSNSSSNASSSHMQQHYAHHNMMHNGNLSAAPGAPAGDPKHYRSSSASDLQHDPNASFSQSSMTGSARSSVFDKLPSHYRHSTRPTVIQPTRPSAQSPSALRKAAAASPVSNLYRPTSASNLFAPPRNSGGLVGYSSNAARESTQDIHRAEPAIVIRPVDLNMPKATPPASIRGAVPTAITQALQLQPNGGGAVLRQVRPASGLRERLQDADVRNLEKTNTALMSYEAVNEELDRLDAKQNTMTIDEQRRYRELLNVVAEQSRARKLLSEIRSPPTSYQEREIPIHVQKEQQQHRRETVIDDIPHSSSSVENVSPVSPPESRKVQFIDEVVQYQTPTSGANHAFFDDVPVLDSPGIVGTNEIYRDPRQRRLNELQDRNRSSENGAADGAKLGFRDKQRLFARQIGEDTAPRQRMNESSAQRLIETDIAATPQKP